MTPLVFAVGAALTAAPEPTPPTLDVQWDGAPACVDTPVLLDTVAQLVPRGVEGTLGLSATREEAGRWRVRITFEDVQREVVHADCALLTEAVALIVAVRADAVASAAAMQPTTPVQRPMRAQGPEPEPTPKPGEFSPARPDAVSRSSSTRAMRGEAQGRALRSEASAPWRWQGGLRAGAAVGTLPRAGGRLAADVGVRWRAALGEWSVGTTLAPAFQPEEPNIEVGFSVFTTSLRGCYVFEGQNVDVPLCAGGEVGFVRANPRGLVSPNDVNALWLAPFAGMRVLRWFGRAAPLAFFDVGTPVLRHRFDVENTPVHTLPPLVVRAGVGVRIGAR